MSFKSKQIVTQIIFISVKEVGLNSKSTYEIEFWTIPKMQTIYHVPLQQNHPHCMVYNPYLKRYIVPGHDTEKVIFLLRSEYEKIK